jgi:hypothetical protein
MVTCKPISRMSQGACLASEFVNQIRLEIPSHGSACLANLEAVDDVRFDRVRQERGPSLHSYNSPGAQSAQRTLRFLHQDPESGPSVGRLSGRNNAQQRDTTLTNGRQCALVSADLGAVIRRPVWSPRRSWQSAGPGPRQAGRPPGWPGAESLRLGLGGQSVASRRPPQGLPHHGAP